TKQSTHTKNQYITYLNMLIHFSVLLHFFTITTIFFAISTSVLSALHPDECMRIYSPF
ncbi:unnamed protein product, partial [Arabidopsis halleri]